MSDTDREKNLVVWRFILLPIIFLTVALLGGLRVGMQKQNFIFIAPPLICLILAALLMMLLVRGRLIILSEWISSELPLLILVSHVLTLVTLFAASAQALNSVLPESGLLQWLFSFFFLWTLWNNLFSEFDAKRLLRSLAVLFGTAFLLKHLILAAFAAPETSFWRRLTGLILEGVSLGALNLPNFAPLTGYISFFTLCLYVIGLFGLLPRMENIRTKGSLARIVDEIAELTPHEQETLREQIFDSKKLLQERTEDTIQT
jgi:hypothetical protein